MTDRLRPPAVAGQFYESDGVALTREVEGCFTSARGPGELPTRHRSAERHLRALVVPHAGYRYSGPMAARAYARVAAERPPRSVLVLGVDHHGAGAPAAVSDAARMTPFGPVPPDHDLVRALARGPIEEDEVAHAPEHSIEVQLPFLQYVLPVPLVVGLMVRSGSYDFLHEVAGIVRTAVSERDVLVIASTDFSHYIPVEEADRLDHLALREIVAREPRGLYDTVARHEISMCGIAPTTVLLDALHDEPLAPELLGWAHSGEAEPMRRVVGYASVVFRSDAALAGLPAEAPGHRRSGR
jgi:AmmeMemoRadiSam system protein B